MKRIFLLLLTACLLLSACAKAPVSDKPSPDTAAKTGSEQTEQEKQTEKTGGEQNERAEETPDVQSEVPTSTTKAPVQQAPSGVKIGVYYSTDASGKPDNFTVLSMSEGIMEFEAEWYDGALIAYATAEMTGNSGSFVWSDECGYQYAEGNIRLIGTDKIRLELVESNLIEGGASIYEYAYYGTQKKPVTEWTAEIPADVAP